LDFTAEIMIVVQLTYNSHSFIYRGMYIILILEMSQPVLEWDKMVHKNVRTSDKQDAGNIIATASDKITVNSEGAKHQYELPKTNVERFNGSEVFLDIPLAELSNYELKKK
jgi:hypothetical protein